MRRRILVIFIVFLLSITSYGCTTDNPDPSPNNDPVEEDNTTDPQENDTTDPEENNTTEDEVNQEVVLYFGNKEATGVAKEIREIQGNVNEQDFIEQVIKELIKGPSSEDLTITIPEGTNVLSVNLDDNIVHVDFSKELQTNHWGGTAGEYITVNSIVNTLTEFDYIDKVKITVEGNPLNLGHNEYIDPIDRNEEAIVE